MIFQVYCYHKKTYIIFCLSLICTPYVRHFKVCCSSKHLQNSLILARGCCWLTMSFCEAINEISLICVVFVCVSNRSDCQAINEICCQHYVKHPIKTMNGNFDFQVGDKVCCTKNGRVRMWSEIVTSKKDSQFKRLCNGEIFFITNVSFIWYYSIDCWILQNILLWFARMWEYYSMITVISTGNVRQYARILQRDHVISTGNVRQHAWILQRDHVISTGNVRQHAWILHAAWSRWYLLVMFVSTRQAIIIIIIKCICCRSLCRRLTV